MKTQPCESLEAVAERFHLSSGETLLSASENGPITLVFLRHFGCTFTRQILRSLEELKAESLRHQATLALVHMLKEGEELRYVSQDQEVRRIADPKCELYRAFGLGNGNLIELFGPRVWWLGAVSIFKGCGVGALAGNGLQMPGAFVFHQGRILASQRAKSAADMPDLKSLFAATPPFTNSGGSAGLVS